MSGSRLQHDQHAKMIIEKTAAKAELQSEDKDEEKIEFGENSPNCVIKGVEFESLVEIDFQCQVSQGQ